MSNTRNISRAKTIKGIEADIGTPEGYGRVQRRPQRELAAMLRMWEAGYSYDELAEKFHYATAANAAQAVESAIAASDVSTPASRDRARQHIHSVLMRHHRTAFMQATDPIATDQAKWINLDLAIVDRLTKLHGLDAPTHVVITPGTEQLQKLVDVIVLAQGGTESGEADPFDAAHIAEAPLELEAAPDGD